MGTWAQLLIIGIAITSAGVAKSAEPSPWKRSQWFEEVSFTETTELKVRFHVNAPLDAAGKPARAAWLIVYALPNGNTIEQTLGCKLAEGLDWHFDIQHVAAQVRALRSLMPNERIVLVCAEAPGLSWPAFRNSVPDANAKIAAMLDQWRLQFGTSKTKVMLTGHSGGGAFMFGVIEGSRQIPKHIDRIAFLDANYSFEDGLHSAKLEHWLRGDNDRRLIVLAYDDREIMFQGKKVVGPDGGTYRATKRMSAALGKSFTLRASRDEPFEETIGLEGRLHFYVHKNPDNKILHTALIGEINGLLHAATLGTAHEETWGTFGGPRAYTKWVQPEPTMADVNAAAQPEDKPAHEKIAVLRAQQHDTLPPRPKNAIGGRDFIKSLEDLSLDQREAAILKEIGGGNFPEFLRNFKSVPVRGTIIDSGRQRKVRGTIQVMPDYLAVGGDDDFVRMPMTPQTAQRIADKFGAVLPTRKLVNAIDAVAELRVAPHPMTVERVAVATFLEHHDIIEKQRAGNPPGQLITGIKKDLVLSPRIFERPQRLAIYGWRQLNGKPIQPLTIVHWNRYVDYSHGVRLIINSIEVDGKNLKIDEMLADKIWCGLVSDEGPMQPARYPTE